MADIETLHKLLIATVKTYQREFKRQPIVDSSLSSSATPSTRVMPFYAFRLLCSIDQNVQGADYGYAAIGSYDKRSYDEPAAR